MTTGKNCLGTFIVELKNELFDKIFLSNNSSYQFVLANTKNDIYINHTPVADEQIRDLIQNKKLTLNQSRYSLSTIPLDFSGIQLLLISNDSRIYQNALTFVILLLIPAILSVIAIIFATKYISKSIADDFDNFMKKLNSTQYINEHAYVSMDSSSEFVSLSNAYNHTLSRIQSLSEKIHEQEILAKNMEIERLQAQINPHFLYNTLNCISGLVNMNRKEECQHALVALADIERMSLKGKPFCTLEEDLHYVNEYTYIQHLRFENRLSIVIDIPKHLYKYMIPKLVIQPLIENAVIHGTSKISDYGIIVVLGNIKNDILQISVKDNGPGFRKDQLRNFVLGRHPDSSTSYGLHNINQRLKLYYGTEYGIVLENNKNKGACVTILIPLTQTPIEN